jgi:thiol-disulfide isomerase/thioredoxin
MHKLNHIADQLQTEGTRLSSAFYLLRCTSQEYTDHAGFARQSHKFSIATVFAHYMTSILSTPSAITSLFKKTSVILIFFLLLSRIAATSTQAQDQDQLLDESPSQAQSETQLNTNSTNVRVHFFHGKGCPHCEKERIFLEQLQQKLGSSVQIFEYEVYYNQSNARTFSAVAKHLSVAVGGVPFTIIGDEPIIGYGGDQTTGAAIANRIAYCLENSCPDTASAVIKPKQEQQLASSAPNLPATGANPLLNEPNPLPSAQAATEATDSKSPTTDSSTPETITLPLFGTITPAALSLPLLTIIIAFMDGFNPCALWILIFLITMLINMKDRKRLYLLGSVFIGTSAAVYFVFLAAWFNFFQFVGYVYWIKVVIGVVAIGTGLFHLKESLQKEQACHVTNPEQRKSIRERIQKITEEQNLWLALIGMVALAVSVNFIEVVCSAGLPAIYTSVLASANVSTLEYYLYLLLYTVIFMLDDLLVFFIAVKSFQATGITAKYAKYSGILGGTIMLIIGFLLIFRPEALMF